MIFTLCIFALEKHLLLFSSVFLMDHWIRWEGKFTILFISCYTLYLDDFFLSELLYIHVFVCLFFLPQFYSHSVAAELSVYVWKVLFCAGMSRVVLLTILAAELWVRTFWRLCVECAEWWQRLCLKEQRICPTMNVASCIYFFLMKECKESELTIILSSYKKAFLFLKLSVKCISSPCRHLRVVTSDVIEESSTE